jgi:hypothetical protein
MKAYHKYALWMWFLLLIFPCESRSSEITAEVMPEGRFRFRFMRGLTGTVNAKYTSDGGLQSLNQSLDSTRISASPDGRLLINTLNDIGGGQLGNDLFLGYLENGVSVNYVGFALDYGITPRLSIGAGVGVFTKTFSTNFSDGNARLIQRYANLNNAALNAALTSDLNSILTQKGYRPLASEEVSGPGEFNIGAKYKAIENNAFIKSFGATITLGRDSDKPDPRKMIDLTLGDGQTDIMLTSFAEYRGIKNVRLGTVLDYIIQLPDYYDMAVMNGDTISAIAQGVELDKGDILRAEGWGEVDATDYLLFRGSYIYETKGADGVETIDYTLDAQKFGAPTAYNVHKLEFGLQFSTVKWFMKKKFFYPFKLIFQYSLPFAGSNTEYVHLANLQLHCYL